jgi:enoyl-CoA hydratase/carnithine racemase
MNDRVLIDIKDHVAQVTLNRADKNNAVDHAMFEALIEAGESLARDGSLRAVVLHGAGDHFCAGIDISVFQGSGIDAVANPEMMRPMKNSPANFFQRAAYVWRELPVPVVAAIDGCAFGAGLQIAAGADLRYASADAQLCIMEIRWGLIPDMAISTSLRHVLSVDKIKELAYTGRVLTGQEARDIGLVTAVHDHPLHAAQAVATEIAGNSPDAIRSIKRLMNTGWQGSEAEALGMEAELQTAVMRAPNQMEAVMAKIHKRKPDFRDSEL